MGKTKVAKKQIYFRSDQQIQIKDGLYESSITPCSRQRPLGAPIMRSVVKFSRRHERNNLTARLCVDRLIDAYTIDGDSHCGVVSIRFI
ncbi:hypothetical protein BIW11_02765 [Tropilaelaps mercedesae]|uniref:Uncharacterized protein n=1 Tax=Tropilaelaps mercedesae TaxID=418985 RepID=A0A1V9XXS8_9ACAR|nr:hypothetical protein BIW11_02765 [Tropilaelaps mercedesae]